MRENLKRFVWGLVLALACVFPQGVFASIDTIAVDVGISVFKTTPIGIVPFEERPGIDWIEEMTGAVYEGGNVSDFINEHIEEARFQSELNADANDPNG